MVARMTGRGGNAGNAIRLQKFASLDRPQGQLHHGLRRHSACAQMPQAQRVVPLCQARALVIAQQLAMKITRRFESQRPQQQQLPRRRLQQIRPAHNFGDLHCGIVGHDRKLVGRNIVPPPNQKITKIGAGNIASRPHIPIAEADRLALRHTKPPVHARGRGKRRRFGSPAAASRIDGLIVGIIRSARRLRQIFSRARTRINKPSIAQSPPRFQVMRAPLALHIRPELPCAIRPLRPADAQPAQVLDHRPRELLPRALRVKILIAQNQRAATLLRPLPCDPKRARVPQVQQPRGRRSQPPTVLAVVSHAGILSPACRQLRFKG